MKAAGPGLWLVLSAAGLLAGCVAPGQEAATGAAGAAQARPSYDIVLARLPEQAAGFSRGMTTDMEASSPGQGRAVDYATLARTGVAARAAIASVILYEHGQPVLTPDTPAAVVTGKLEEGVAEATSPAPGRRMAETSRHVLEVAGGTPMQCAVIEGTYGRSAMWQQVCVGVAAGRFLKVFVAVPARQKALLTEMDADAFTRSIAQAARAR
ncbi:hypothetical protein BKE38_23165 [Pseudoroseomonas deserti]|uniref:Uncharacterized protein n=1 Tax=Teichococcus deserti TaxID=1817963 RepID=A0A1V2GWG5_9PROT|nr:hypothetical protein [Pseudoroseomonas deserti]ONG47484.1 hypothetical protein BKE38_23165 [Pseudoroseomonas deserti]